MSRAVWLTGVASVLTAMPATSERVWQMTVQTWRRGPQNVGFALAHSLGIVVWAMGWLGAAVWLLSVLLWGVFQRRWFSRRETCGLVLIALVLGLPIVSYGTWHRITTACLGLSPHAPERFVYFAGVGDEGVAEDYLNRGMNPNIASDGGCTPLIAAAANGHREVVTTLLQRGADATLSGCGTTPLHGAARSGNEALVATLLKAGADPFVKDSDGFRPADGAFLNGHHAIVKLLER